MMKINIEDKTQFLAGALLQSEEFCERVVQSEEYKKNHNPSEISVKLVVSGEDIDAQILEDYLRELADTYDKHIRSKYDADNIDNLVEDRATELLREYAGNALETLGNVQNKLEMCDDLLVPPWEREKKPDKETPKDAVSCPSEASGKWRVPTREDEGKNLPAKAWDDGDGIYAYGTFRMVLEDDPHSMFRYFVERENGEVEAFPHCLVSEPSWVPSEM